MEGIFCTWAANQTTEWPWREPQIFRFLPQLWSAQSDFRQYLGKLALAKITSILNNWHAKLGHVVCVLGEAAAVVREPRPGVECVCVLRT
jgi:hypothetical protein